MPCLLVFTQSDETVEALQTVAQTCGWDIEDGRRTLQQNTPPCVDSVDAALFDLCQDIAGVQEILQQVESSAPFLPLIFLSIQGASIHEIGSGLRYHIAPDQIPDIEHVLLSLSLGFPADQFAAPESLSGNSVPRLMIVDDNMQLASLIGRALRSMERYDVQVVTSGFEALSLLPAFRPDVAIVDLVLRDMDGREICAFIRGHEKLQHTKIIGVSGYLSERRAEDDRVQCDMFIEKPFRMRDIVDKVMTFLQ